MNAGADKKALVLLSGGLDSATVLAIAEAEGYKTYALSFRYGQRHSNELESARLVAEAAKVREHRIMDLNLDAIGGSALTEENIQVPKQRSYSSLGSDIPATYVPARNTIFLALALAWAEVLGANDIFIGVNICDYSGYPDCRPEFIRSFEKTANLATRAGVEGEGTIRIRTPLIEWSKAEIIRCGIGLGVDYALTTSCYDPGPLGEACGGCDACLLRLKGFDESGYNDPKVYLKS